MLKGSESNPPLAPTNLVASLLGSNQIRLAGFIDPRVRETNVPVHP